MFRLWVFIAQLVVITLALTFVVHGVVPYPFDVLLGFVGAILVIFAISAFREAGGVRRDLAALRSAGEGGPPRDGDRIAIIGKLKAHGLPLRAPFTRRECVYYRYSAGRDRGPTDEKDRAMSEYSGLAMARCLVRDGQREMRLVGAPMFEGFEGFFLSIPPGDCRENAERYVAETRFETLAFGDTEAMTRSAHATFDDRDGHVRRDVRLDPAGPIGEMALEETIVPADVDVCAIGTWSTSQAGLVQMLGTRELLTVHCGNAEAAAARLTANMKRHVLGGSASVALVALVVVWRFIAG